MATITEKINLDLSSSQPISLSRLAVPGTARVTLNNIRLTTNKWDIYGAPILPDALIKLLRNKHSIASLYDENSKEIMEVTYKERELNFSLDLLNNLDYINYKVKSLKGFNEYLESIKLFKKVYPNCKDFEKVIIFGMYYIDECGLILKLYKKYYNVPDVMDFNSFIKENVNLSASLLCQDAFPDETTICPYCLKPFNIKDIMDGTIEKTEDGDFFHEKCLDEYSILSNKYDMLRIINYGYPLKSDYTEIPNQYGCDCKICKRRPWYIFHTPDGDIKMGWRKRVISIEFMEGFKDFPMSLFDLEDVTKWEKGIHAYGELKAINYLNTVYNYLH